MLILLFKLFGVGNILGSVVFNKDVEIYYIFGCIKCLVLVFFFLLVIFFLFFSSNILLSDEEGMFIDIEDEFLLVEEFMSCQVNLYNFDGYLDGVDLISGDEDGEDLDDELDVQKMYDIGVVDDDDEEVKSGNV